MSEIEVLRREYRHSNLKSCILQDPPILLRLFTPFVQLRKRLDPALYTVFTQAMISQQSELKIYKQKLCVRHFTRHPECMEARHILP